MKAYVINLAHASARRANMEEQLTRSGLAHEFVDAVDGRALDQDERATLVDEQAVAEAPWWLTPGAIGCALSHLRAYERVLSDGEAAALVLEDDVVLSDGVGELIEDIGPHMNGSEVALLYYRSFSPCRLSAADSVELVGGRRLAYPLDLRGLVTTAGYVITAEACRRMSTELLPIRAAADSWDRFYASGLLDALRVVSPRPLAVRTDFKSTIGYLGEASLRLRATNAVARHRIFPLYQLLTLNRRRVERRMSRVSFVPERSPIAARHA